MMDVSLANKILSATSWIDSNGRSRTELAFLTCLSVRQLLPVSVHESVLQAQDGVAHCKGHIKSVSPQLAEVMLAQLVDYLHDLNV